MPVHVSTENRWLLRFHNGKRIRLRLFCFPFAGSSASVFRPWIDQLPEGIEVLGIQLPGRENRLSEPCIRNMEEIVERLEVSIRQYCEPPFVFFGHSLGSLIAYQLLHRIEEISGLTADLFFASGSPAPHSCPTSNVPLRFSQAQILSDLERISGPHTNLLKNPELFSMFLPMLQADFEVYANFRYQDLGVLSCPIIAIRGADDGYVSLESQLGWERHTDCSFKFHVIPGKHLFMVDSAKTFLPLIHNYLMPLVKQPWDGHLSASYSA